MRALILSVLVLLLVVAAVSYEAPSAQLPLNPAPPAPPTAPPTPAPSPGAAPTALQTGAPPAPTPEAAVAALLDRAARARRNGDLAAALRDYRQAAATDPAPALALLELGQAEVEAGDPAAGRDTLRRLLAAEPDEPLRGRAHLALARAELDLGNPRETLRLVEVEGAPDGLSDLAALLRAEAALDLDEPDTAGAELSRPEVRGSTNRLLLERAGELAERSGEPGLAGELYARGGRYFGWSVERTRMLEGAGSSFERAGRDEEAVAQYRILVEDWGWTPAGQVAAEGLERLRGLTAYHRGLAALNAGRREAARASLEAASRDGSYARQAASRLQALEEAVAWRVADDSGTTADYRWIREHYPEGPHVAEARFREGLVHYQAGGYAGALEVWDGGLPGARGDDRARLLLWAGKALVQLDHVDEGRARWEAAAAVQPTGYYALRARDRLSAAWGWPSAGGLGGGSTSEERAEAEGWIGTWSGAGPEDPLLEGRARRGLGLQALGLLAEAEAEFNGLIAETRDSLFLFRLAGLLAEQEVWVAASRAAARVVALSPAGAVADAPAALRRLVYPEAFPDLVSREAERRGVDPLLLLALVHQESRYDPFALSPAEARGLTQVIPSTGRMIASALGRPFSPGDLYRPTIAVEFGALYLADRLNRYGGDPFRALAAYNAGEGPLGRWSAADPDLFVERIDYPETRSYVRQVYLHHALYRGLAGR